MKNAATPLILIQEQLECFERQMRRAGRGGADRTGFDLETRISLSLRLHEMIKDVETNWGDRVRAGQLPYVVEEAQELQGLYKHWLKTAMRLLTQIKHAESKGRRLAMAERLKDTIGFCYQARTDIRGVNKAFEQLERGEGIQITEGTNGIHRRRAG